MNAKHFMPKDWPAKILGIICEPTCCEVNKVENCNQGRACPVRNGTHKPSDALINIEEPNGKAD